MSMSTKQIQTILITLGYDLGSYGADGVFGGLTKSAIRKFQSDYNVKINYPGTVGPKTEEALLLAFNNKTGSVSSTIDSRHYPVWMEEAIRLQGTKEVSGSKSNPTILRWAKDISGWVSNYYTNDDIPWCGLFIAHCVGYTLPEEPLPSNPLGALNWNTFGIPCEPQPGAILTFKRTGGGHVGLYVSEDDDYFHVLGGNQSNTVNITKVAKSRHQETRWPKTASAPTGSRVKAKFSGSISTNEA